MKSKKKNLLFSVSLAIFAFSLFSLLVSRLNSDFAEFLTGTLILFLKNFLLFFSNCAPFSIFELLCCISPAILLFLIFILFKSKRENVRHRFFSIVGVFLLIFSLLINTVFIGYGVDVGFKFEECNEEELKFAFEYLRSAVNSFQGAEYPQKDVMSQKLYTAYSELNLPGVYLTKASPKIKKIKHETLASRLGYLGGYSFLTSEISINFSAPHYTAVFTAAHEMAHLFGISGEAEASFYAYLASLRTADEAIIYSANLSAFEYVAAAVFKADPEFYVKVYETLSETVKKDLSEYHSFYYSESTKITESAEKLNGAVLYFADSNGDSDYSAFVKIFVPFLLGKNNCN